MKKLWIIATLLSLTLIIAIVFSSRSSIEKRAARPEGSPTPRQSEALAARPESSNASDEEVDEARYLTKMRTFSVNLGPGEFERFRVSLPQPENKAWRGQLWNSQNCFEKNVRLTVSDVLPIWIRKAVLAGESAMAARYLWSLMRLAEADDPEVATNAVFHIYRLGDRDGFAAGKMREWVENEVAYRNGVTRMDGLSSVSMDVRARVLDELSFYRDHSLDDVIFSKWREKQASEGKEPAAVDYAYYLERHGRELPSEYWMQRLEKPYGFDHAVEIAEKKGTPEVSAKLQAIFEQLQARPATTPDASRAASVASALFRQTGDAHYRDYLAEQARAQLASGAFESNLPKVLEGLAATNDKVALEVVTSAIQNENEGVREMAINALSKSRDPAAQELLFESAIQKAKQGKGFPARELRALLAQGDPSADSKYERLQQALLSGQLGWSATTSDFEALEFFRKHGRQ